MSDEDFAKPFTNPVYERAVLRVLMRSYAMHEPDARIVASRKGGHNKHNDGLYHECLYCRAMAVRRDVSITLGTLGVTIDPSALNHLEERL